MSVYTANPNRVSTSYIRGLGLVAARTDKGITFYHYNAHGDVVQLTDANGNIIRDYTYDAFGVEQDADDTDANPFRYCGEQYDSETGNYYLRARYYTPGVGSFTQEDPVMDGLNWYGYCAGNPVRFVDPSGLFGSNTKLSQSQRYNPDVVTLQRQLVSLGYLDMSEGGWGCFGPKTLSAVNKYKDDNGLWNFGEYKGIVGETTWRHLGLPIDNDYEVAAHNYGTPELKNKVFYATGNGPGIVLPGTSQWITPSDIVKDTAKEIGITLASGEAGFYKIEGNAGPLDWEGNMLRATADAKVTNERVGASALAEFAGVQGSFNIPISLLGHNVVVTAELSMLGVGGEFGWSKEKGLGAKVVPGVGGGIFFNIK